MYGGARDTLYHYRVGERQNLLQDYLINLLQQVCGNHSSSTAASTRSKTNPTATPYNKTTKNMLVTIPMRICRAWVQVIHRHVFAYQQRHRKDDPCSREDLIGHMVGQLHHFCSAGGSGHHYRATCRCNTAPHSWEHRGCRTHSVPRRVRGRSQSSREQGEAWSRRPMDFSSRSGFQNITHFRQQTIHAFFAQAARSFDLSFRQVPHPAAHKHREARVDPATSFLSLALSSHTTPPAASASSLHPLSQAIRLPWPSFHAFSSLVRPSPRPTCDGPSPFRRLHAPASLVGGSCHTCYACNRHGCLGQGHRHRHRARVDRAKNHTFVGQAAATPDNCWVESRERRIRHPSPGFIRSFGPECTGFSGQKRGGEKDGNGGFPTGIYPPDPVPTREEGGFPRRLLLTTSSLWWR